MRRNLDTTEQIKILSNNYVGNLAYIAGASPYIVPMTYHYDKVTHTITSYSSDGHKIAAMRKNSAVALIVHEIISVTHWESVQVHGTFEELSGIDAKHMLREFSDGVKGILSGNKGIEAQYISDFSAKIETEGTPIVFRIKIDDITGKKRDL